jgi:hypothetical protein
MLKKLYDPVLKRPILYLLCYGAILRILVTVFYHTITLYPDSRGYIELSKFILNLSFENYTGERTPGFPALIALAGGNLYLTAFFQTIIGLANIALIYDLSKLKTKNKALAFGIAFISASFLHVLFFDFAIVTETLTLFFVLVTFWFIEKFKVLEATTPVKYIFLLSIVLSALYLTRPLFIYVPIGLFAFYLVKNYLYGFKKMLFKASFFLILPLLSLYSWSSLNEKNIGYFASTYYLGLNLSQTATPFFEKAPEEDKLIRDIVVKHRELNPMYKSLSKNPMTVWYAWNELKEKTKLSDPDLSNELGRISKNLFKKHPDLYLKQVFVSWKDFWGSSLFFWRTGNIKNQFIQTWTYRLWYSFQQYLLIGINMLFLVFSIKKLYDFVKTKFKTFDSDLLMVAIILSGSLAQALVIYGSNSRFCIPFFPLIVYFVCSSLIALKNKKIKHA